MGKKKSLVTISGFLVCIVVLAGYLLASGNNSIALGNNAGITGVVEGNEVDLAFKMAGAIDEIHVKEGDVVKAGDLLAALTDDELLAKRAQAKAAYSLAQVKMEYAQKGVAVTSHTSNAQVDQAQASVEAAQAQYEANKNGARPEEITQLKAKQQAAQSAYDIALKQKDRMQHLYQEGAVPKVSAEEADTQFEKAKAELAAANEQLKMGQSGARQEQKDAAKAQVHQAAAAYQQAVAAREQVGLKELDVKSAQAGVEQAKGALDEVESYLRQTKLTAPVNGIVKSISVQKGELVAQGFTVITLQAQDEQFVKFYVNENALANVQVGSACQLYVPALNKEVTGKVTVVAPAADFAVKKATQESGDRDIRAFQVKIDVSGQDLRPGLTVEWKK